MKSIQNHIENYRNTVQAAWPHEQILAVGIFSRSGAMKSLAIGQISPLAGMVMRSSSKKRANGLPQNVVMGITQTRLLTFQYKPRGTSIRLKKMVAEWPWQAVRVEAGTGRQERQLYFHLADGSTVQLENLRSFGQYSHLNDPFYAALGLAIPG
ncbi:MAG: hypothetical protein JWM34_4768 [Ilumatobacteraceae bacterium]|nr:hypothetical protein [Ilumatobacteraceae bacterium]